MTASILLLSACAHRAYMPALDPPVPPQFPAWIQVEIVGGKACFDQHELDALADFRWEYRGFQEKLRFFTDEVNRALK